MSLLGYALKAAMMGLYVFPVAPGDKEPARRYPHRPAAEAPWRIKWSEVATTHIPTIIEWWNEEPMRNIGIACKPSGLLVIDCDIKDGYDGWDEWAAVANEADPTWLTKPTRIVRTGGGGAHIYFKWPAFVKSSQSKFSDHVDVRSSAGKCGGFVLGEGSVTTKGPYILEEDEPIADAPPWLVTRCRVRPKPTRPYQQPAAGALGGLQRAVAEASEGKRNDVLYWAACSAREDGRGESEALAALVPSAELSGLSEREAVSTIRSAFMGR